jgi:TetR/AcrR family transcriptional regulator
MNSSPLQKKRDKTIQRIFDAATKTFADKGFAGARMDEIARLAQVNKATIYYHVGDKHTLYERILSDIFSGIAEHLTQSDNATSSAEERLKVFVRTWANLVDHNADLAAIMLREQAAGAKDFPEIVARDFSRIIGLLTEILGKGVNTGIFKPATPVVVHLMIIGTIVFTKMSSPIRSKLEDHVAAEIEGLILDAVRK